MFGEITNASSYAFSWHAFSVLIVSLVKEKNLKASLEKEVAKRAKELIQKNKELEDFQQKTINRELKMIELKRKIIKLESKISSV